MFARLVAESFVRNPRRKLITGLALMVGMAVATATLTVALDAGDRLAREFSSLGANLLVTPKSDTLPVEIGGVDYRPVDEGAYLSESDLGKLKSKDFFWHNNILGFAPFLGVPVRIATAQNRPPQFAAAIGTWYQHAVPVAGSAPFVTGLKQTHSGWKIQGRWFGDDPGECVLGESLAHGLAGGAAVGRKIRIEPAGSTPGAAPSAWRECTVTGIVSTGEAEDDAILVPLAAAQEMSGHAGKFRQLFVSALTKPADALAQRNPATLDRADYDRWYCSPYISSISLRIEQTFPGANVHAIRRVAETEGRILSRVGILLWLVTLAAMLAAALGVAATAATTVLDRRTEIGIMKAIGATNFLVAAIFLSEQLLLALVGGAAGFVLGAGLARLLGASVFGSPAPPRLIVLPAVLGLAALVAILGSLIPLRRAARFNPAPILRGE
ncbi:MAG TPA: ABC transporter permease [Candidatus Acidoferrales bacterium]|nr:ABC transporter permease [Candidatus Acidoferrales bacterium]